MMGMHAWEMGSPVPQACRSTSRPREKSPLWSLDLYIAFCNEKKAEIACVSGNAMYIM